MLQAQVNYWTLLENAKHNRAMEALGAQTNAETFRHDVAQETLGSQSLAETKRHQMAQEELTSMSNRAALIQAYSQQKRVEYDYQLGLGNLANSAKQAQASLEQASAASQQAAVARLNAESNRIQARASQSQAATAEMNAETRRIEAALSGAQSILNFAGDYNKAKMGNQTQIEVANIRSGGKK